MGKGVLSDYGVIQNDGTKLNVILGSDADGNTLVTDVTKAGNILVAGISGSGKSNLLNTIICSLIESAPLASEVLVIGLKPLEYADYDACCNVHVFETLWAAMKALTYWINEAMADRLESLRTYGCRNLEEYNQKNPNNIWHPILIIIDELGDLISRDRKTTEEVLVRVGKCGDATGIHVVAATHEPNGSILSGRLRKAFPARISFKVSNVFESRFVLKTGGAQKLEIPGKAIFLKNGVQTCFKTPLVSKEEVNRVTSKVSREQKEADNRGEPVQLLCKVGSLMERRQTRRADERKEHQAKLKQVEEDLFWLYMMDK